MSDADGDNVWELTIPLAADTFEYKFAYDSWAGQESLTPGSLCTSTIDNFTNRSIIVTGEATLDPVCWGSCEPCVVGFVGNGKLSPVELAPNPATNFLQFTIQQSTNELLQVRVLNALGKCVLNSSLAGTKGSVDTSNLPEGIYFLNISSKTVNSTQSFIVTH
jgi:hypothetical protein